MAAHARHTILRTIALSLVAGSVLAAHEGRAEGPAQVWRGRYLYAHDGGRTAGGSAIGVTYALVLGPAAGRTGCALESRGFQTDERILCQSRTAPGEVRVGFVSYGDGRTVNKYGVERYRPGAGLFTLAEKDGSLVTTWEAFAPGEGMTPGRYFARAR